MSQGMFGYATKIVCMGSTSGRMIGIAAASVWACARRRSFFSNNFDSYILVKNFPSRSVQRPVHGLMWFLKCCDMCFRVNM